MTYTDREIVHLIPQKLKVRMLDKSYFYEITSYEKYIGIIPDNDDYVVLTVDYEGNFTKNRYSTSDVYNYPERVGEPEAFSIIMGYSVTSMISDMPEEEFHKLFSSAVNNLFYNDKE